MEKEKEKRHPKTFEPFAFILMVATSVLGAIIGMQIVTTGFIAGEAGD
ncbi:hypothetical protein ACIFQM_18935 [Paenibacillus sp. NRS-1782]